MSAAARNTRFFAVLGPSALFGGLIAALITLFSIALALILVPSAAAQSHPDACDASKLPAGIRQFIAHNYNSWRYEAVSDLNEEYQRMWTAHHPDECPGFSIGHFHKFDVLSYALLLLSGSGNSVRSRLVVIESQNGRGYESTLLMEEKVTYHYEVISKANPGTYSHPEGAPKIRVSLNGIILEALESGSTLYYWRNGRFRSLTLSE